MCMSKPKTPELPAMPAAPAASVDQTDTEGRAAMNKAKKKNELTAKLAKGMGSTILTSQSGVADQATVEKKTLLGGN